MKQLTYLLLLISGLSFAQQKEIKLYNGAAPGSESWTWKEGVNNNNRYKVMTVYNVVNPTLTVFLPEPGTENGTAIIIAPGGGFHFLAIDHEGNNAAGILVKKGITVFVLKYRLFHIQSDSPFEDMLNDKNPKARDIECEPVIPLAVADGRTALTYVRAHAAEYKINPNRIGFMGFSAGGRIAASTAFNYTTTNRPDFVIPVYADMPESIQGPVLPDAPPLFIACTSDDDFGFATHAISIYNKWYAAKRPVELHMFAKGGHGFGIGSEKNTTFQWLEKLAVWLSAEGLMTSK